MRSIAQAIALLLITSATALPKNPGEPWLTTTVYTTDGGGSTSLAFTPDGHPAIAFNEDYDLIYGVFDGEAWAFTRLGGVEGEITLAFTPSGQPAICHVDLDGDIGEELVLRYTEFDGATWSTDILGEVAGEACSLAFTPQGDPAVSYFAPGGDLIYAVFDGGAWQYSTIDSGGDSSGSTSLGFTPGGQPAIGYCINDIKYAVFDGASWAISTVEDLVSTPLSHSGRTSLAFSPEGWPAISFYDDPSGSIRYAISDGETWSITPIDSAQADARTTLAFAPDSGQPAVSYSDSASRTVRYARLDGSVWSVATADRGAYASLAFTPAGLPAISVQDDDDESVRYSVGTSDSLAAKNRVFNFPLTTDQVVPAPTVEGDATPSGSARVVVNSETGGFAVSGIFGGMTRGSEANSGVINPLSPRLQSLQRRPQAPHAKSKFLATLFCF
jgi:hypothetical protein